MTPRRFWGLVAVIGMGVAAFVAVVVRLVVVPALEQRP